MEFRELLRNYGLLPSFLRVEYSAAFHGFVASDAFWPVYVPVQSHIVLGDTVLVNLPNPFNPCFILDMELAGEYVQSRSFQHDGSATMCSWGVRERAAMGLCLENVPEPFQTRYVVPVSRQSDMVPAFARISHLPNNYANDPRMPLGKVRMDALFVGAHELTNDGCWGRRDPDRPSSWTCLRAPDGKNGPAAKEALARHGLVTTANAALPDGPVASSLQESEEARSPHQYYLVSAHDTILYADGDLQLLKHAPFGIAPLNLVLELEGPRGRLLMRDDSQSEVRQVLIEQSAGEIRTHMGRAEFDCQIEIFADDRIGIRTSEHYLAPDRDGVVRNNRSWCEDWERYRLVRADTLRGLALLRRFDWLSHGDRRIISLAAQPIGFGREQPLDSSALAATLAPHAVELRRELVFGPARLRLAGKDPSLFLADRSDHRPRNPPGQVHIVDASGITHDFSRFTPLVHYRVCGDESYYERLRLSLDSLEKYGCFGGTLGVACDRPPDELVKHIPNTFRHRLIVSEASKDRSRFNVDGLRHGLYNAYQPILCCDVNVVFDASITDLLIDVLLSRRMCCPSNASVIGLESTACIRASSDVVGMTGTAQMSERAQFFDDQRSADNVVQNTRGGDSDILARYCRLSRAPEDLSPAGRRGLVEFRLASEAADASAKISIMTSYLDNLHHAAASENNSDGIELNPSIPGRLEVEELEQLASLARRVPPNGCIVEVGSLFGQSAWAIAKNTRANVTVYCLDPWVREPWMLPLEQAAGQTLSLDIFSKNTFGILNIIPLRGHSPRDFSGWQRTIDLLFESSVHGNPALHQNLMFWSRFVRPGGVICVHGYSDELPNIKAEVDQFSAALGTQAKVRGTLWSIRVPDDPAAEVCS
jgi:hypothetical protein